MHGATVPQWSGLKCGGSLRVLRVIEASHEFASVVNFVAEQCTVIESLTLDDPVERQLEELGQELDLPPEPAAHKGAGCLHTPLLPATLKHLHADSGYLLPAASGEKKVKVAHPEGGESSGKRQLRSIRP